MNLAVLQLVQIHGYVSLVPRQVPEILSLVSAFKRKFKDCRDGNGNGEKRRLRGKTTAPTYSKGASLQAGSVWR